MKKWKNIVIVGGLIGLGLTALFEVFALLQQPYLAEMATQMLDSIHYPNAAGNFAQSVNTFGLLNAILKWYFIVIGLIGLTGWNSELQQ
jgi:uncharacterized membrane protein